MGVINKYEITAEIDVSAESVEEAIERIKSLLDERGSVEWLKVEHKQHVFRSIGKSETCEVCGRNLRDPSHERWVA